MLVATCDPFWDVCLFFESLLLILSGLKFEPKMKHILHITFIMDYPWRKKNAALSSFCYHRNQSQTIILSSNQTVLYTWDDPTCERTLMWNVYGRSKPNYPAAIAKVSRAWGFKSIWTSIFYALSSSTRWSVYPSVGPSVTFSFQVIKARMPWPTFLKLSPHIYPGLQRNPIVLRVTGLKVNVIGVKYAEAFPINNLRKPWPTFLKLSPHKYTLI